MCVRLCVCVCVCVFVKRSCVMQLLVSGYWCEVCYADVVCEILYYAVVGEWLLV